MTKSTEAVQRLRSLPEVAAALKSIDQAWAADLAAYTAGLPGLGYELGSKAIKDSVWGMITLTGEEVLVVDSPVFQRLRRIKQLGATFFTFPTADYSRFEHSLGVLHQGTRMMSAIAERSKGARGEVEAASKAIRLACLLHDVGHLPLSHLAERHFQDFPDQLFTDCHEAIEEHFGGAWDASLSELISFLVIESDAFKTFLTGPCRFMLEDVDSAALAIIGYPPPGRPFIKQMISNVIDADKLDYMFRDSHYTSVPLPVDLHRLLYKLKLLPNGAATEDGKDASGCLALDLGGAHLIEDLIVARRILSRQVYRHHKTLAAEQLVLAALEIARPTVISLVTSEDDYFFGLLAQSAGQGTGAPKEVEQLVRDLRTRQLPRRGFAYGHALIPRETSDRNRTEVPDAVKSAEMRFAEQLKRHEGRSELAADALRRYQELCALLSQPGDAVRRFYFDISSQLVAPDIELFVERPDETLLRYDGFPPKAAAFAHSPEDNAYAFFSGRRQATALAYVACETVLYDRFGIQYTRGSADHAKIDFRQVEDTKRQIEAVDPSFFEARWGLRPRSARARARGTLPGLLELVERFRGRREPPRLEDLQSFLDQFPEALVSAVIEVLHGVQLIDDMETASRAQQHFATADAKSPVFVPLTRTGESSSLMAYDLRMQGLNVLDLGEAFAAKEPAVVFFEDSLLSGKQARSVLQCWFGLEPESPDDRVRPLEESQRAWLKGADVALLFYVSREGGEQALLHLMSQLGLGPKGDRAGKVIHSMGKAAALSDVMSTRKAEPLEAFLQEVGVELLRQTKAKANPQRWTAERVEDCALGYSSARGLTVFRQNTPTSTLTPLWLGGTFRGRPWRPLFKRYDESTIIKEREERKAAAAHARS